MKEYNEKYNTTREMLNYITLNSLYYLKKIILKQYKNTAIIKYIKY